MSVCLAVNCFPAAFLTGLWGHEISVPAEVERHVDPRARHQGLRQKLRGWGEDLELRVVESDELVPIKAMVKSLGDKEP